MAFGFSTTLRNQRLDLIATALNAGPGAGTVKLYTAPRPAAGAAVGSAVLLGTFTLSDPAAASATGGVLTFSAIAADTSADAGGGTPGTPAVWARFADSTGAFVADCSVSGTGGGGDITMDSVNVQTGAVLTPGTWTITDGNP